MPPALGLQRALNRSRCLPTQLKPISSSTCLFCSLSPSNRGPSALLRPSTSTSTSSSRRHLLSSTLQRHQSTSSSSPRLELQNALLNLQSSFPNAVNLPRLQLALRNLSQPPGHESIRVAFLSLRNSTASSLSSTSSSKTATRLLHLTLADPLSPAAAWEAQLEAHDTAAHPLVVRVEERAGTHNATAQSTQDEDGVRLVPPVKEHVIPEVRAFSPLLGGGNLEVLVGEAGPFATAAGGGEGVVDAVLVPTVDVTATTAGHVAAVASPVHMAVLVGDGVRGAVGILGLQAVGEGADGDEVIVGAVNFAARVREEDFAGCKAVVPVNIEVGREGLELFRADVSNAMRYEALWTEANVGRVGEWLRRNALANGEGITKKPVRSLISSLLRSARAAIQKDEAQELSAGLRAKVSPDSVAHLNKALAEWAQNAHEELQQQLDAAFASRSWSRLGWWKLIWRADDVGMLTSEMVALRFLPEAEQRIIYLAGRIEEAGVVEGQQGHPLYPGPALPQPPAARHRQDAIAPNTTSSWPTHIPFTRNYLQEKTVPALQALAQKLVVQSASLAGLSTALAGLSYLSALGAYECGAIAALGTVLSFRRLQQKWDAAREYWEGEVREEGRKAIRASEASVAEVLDQAGKPRTSNADRSAQLEKVNKAEEIIKRAEEALARMK